MNQNNENPNVPKRKLGNQIDPDLFSWAMLSLAAISASSTILFYLKNRQEGNEKYIEKRNKVLSLIRKNLVIINEIDTEIERVGTLKYLSSSSKNIETGANDLIRPGKSIYLSRDELFEYRKSFDNLTRYCRDINFNTIDIILYFEERSVYFPDRMIQYQIEKFESTIDKLRHETNFHFYYQLAKSAISSLEEIYKNLLNNL